MAEPHLAQVRIRSPGSPSSETDAWRPAGGTPESLVAVGPGSNGHAQDRMSLADRVRAQTAREAAPSRRLDFGRYQGWTLAEVGRYDPDYLRWLSRHSSGVRYRNAILQLLITYDKQPVAASRSSRSSR